MADLVTRDASRQMMSLREAMDRLFEESFLRPSFALGDSGAVLSAPVDVYETEDGLELKAEVPGWKPEDIDVTITGDVLTIKGEYKQEKQGSEKKRNYLRQERHYGSFCRQLTVPESIDAGKVTAEFENGVLTLRMPKSEAMKPKTVRVNVK